MRVADHHTYFVGCHEWGFSVWAHNQYTGTQANAVLESLNLGRLRGGQPSQLARAVEAGDVALVTRLLESHGVKGPALEGVVARLFSDAKVTPNLAVSAPVARFPKSELTPNDLLPTPGAKNVGGTYLVDGRRPISIDLSNPKWAKTLPEGMVEGGIYIVRSGDQILKTGDASWIRGRFKEYRGWHTHDGFPVQVDYYPIAKDVPLHRAANDLRTRLKTDGWNLPRDWENIGPNVTPVVRVTGPGG